MLKKNKPKAKIVQFSDESRVFPDGSRIVYSETETKIVLYQKYPFNKSVTYVYDRKTQEVFVNSKKGSNSDKLKMIKLGQYFIANASEKDLITVDVFTKD